MDKKLGRRAASCLFAAYCVFLLWLLFLRRIGAPRAEQGANFRFFDTIGRYVRVLRRSSDASLRRMSARNLLGNAVIFLPFGVYLPMRYASMRRFFPFFLGMNAIIFAVELAQKITALGVCDVDDWLLNLLGALAGFGLFACIRRRQRTKSTSRT